MLRRLWFERTLSEAAYLNVRKYRRCHNLRDVIPALQSREKAHTVLVGIWMRARVLQARGFINLA
jgi:hypothetical protein